MVAPKDTYGHAYGHIFAATLREKKDAARRIIEGELGGQISKMARVAPL